MGSQPDGALINGHFFTLQHSYPSINKGPFPFVDKKDMYGDTVYPSIGETG